MKETWVQWEEYIKGTFNLEMMPLLSETRAEVRMPIREGGKRLRRNPGRGNDLYRCPGVRKWGAERLSHFL